MPRNPKSQWHDDTSRDHNDRLQDLERQLLPALAGIEATMVAMKDDLEEVKHGVVQVKEDLVAGRNAFQAAALKDQAQDSRLQDLEDDEKDRAAYRKTLRNWVMGILATLVTAAALSWLGWR